jgi:hypothetical protein
MNMVREEVDAWPCRTTLEVIDDVIVIVQKG